MININRSCFHVPESVKKIFYGIPSYFFLFQKAVDPKQVARERDFRLIADSQLITAKLKKEWDAAQLQKDQEKDTPRFQYLSCNKRNLEVHSESLSLGNYSVGVCHAQGRRPTMEDQHIATSFGLSIQRNFYPVQVFGVFDGHGGGAASSYVEKNLEKELKKALLEFNSEKLSDEGIWNALKMTTVRLSEDLKKNVKEGSGTTATIALMLDGKLWTVNVGDSRTILENKGTGDIVQLSEDAKPDDPRYRKSIEKRGGKVVDWGCPRINGSLAVGRAIGDRNVGDGMTARPKITMISLSQIKPGSHLILACDGIYDVASTRQIGGAASKERGSAQLLAENIVYSAYQAGSVDNLSALVVHFPEPKQGSSIDFSWILNYFKMS